MRPSHIKQGMPGFTAGLRCRGFIIGIKAVLQTSLTGFLINIDWCINMTTVNMYFKYLHTLLNQVQYTRLIISTDIYSGHLKQAPKLTL